MRLDNKVLADNNKVDKYEAESYVILGLVTLALQLPFFMVWFLLNVVLIDVFWFVALVFL